MKISNDVFEKKSECIKLLIIVACQNVDIHNDIKRIYITLFYKTKKYVIKPMVAETLIDLKSNRNSQN